MTGKTRPVDPVRRALLAALPGLALLPSACSNVPPSILRLGYNSWPAYELFALAEQLGYYRQLGLAIQLVEFTSLGDSRRAFERGQIDVAAGTAVELLTAASALRQPVQTFFLTDISEGADYLIAHSSITNLSGLQGKRVAVEPGSLNLLLLHLALKSAQMSLRDVTLVPIPQVGMPMAFDKGEVDAVVVYPPVSEHFLAHETLHPKILFDSSQTSGAIVDLLYANQDTITHRAGELAALVAGIELARAYTQQHQDDAYARMAARTSTPRGNFERDMQGLRLLPLADQLERFRPGGSLELTLSNTLDALNTAGMRLSPQTEGWINGQIIHKAQSFQ